MIRRLLGICKFNKAVLNFLDARNREAMWHELGSYMLAVGNRPEPSKTTSVPLLRNHSYLGLFVSGIQFQRAPIFVRWSSTRAARVFTSSVSFGNGVA